MAPNSSHGGPERGVPVDPDSAFFWEGVKRGETIGQRCDECSAVRHPPGPVCSRCQSFSWSELRTDGRGIVYSWAIPRYPHVGDRGSDYVLVLVDLLEGFRVVGLLGDGKGLPPAIGAEVILNGIRTAEDGRALHFDPLDRNDDADA